VTAERAALLLLVAGAAASAAGCASFPAGHANAKLPVDPNSPVARDVAAALAHPGPYPKFAQIPKAPKDVPPSSLIRAEVASLNREQGKLETQQAALPPPATDTEAFAAAAGARTPDQAQAPGPQSPQETESYAQGLRERATPPPPLR
jgi:hypothetical protein